MSHGAMRNMFCRSMHSVSSQQFPLRNSFPHQMHFGWVKRFHQAFSLRHMAMIPALLFSHALYGQTSSNVAMKPSLSDDHIQYVSSSGNNSNDGLSIGSAKLTVYKAAQSLPGGSPTHAGHGTIIISGTVSIGGPLAPNGGLWIMGPGDPNAGNPPPGWLIMSGAGSLNIDCYAPFETPSNGNKPECAMTGGGRKDRVHPAVWISGISQGISLNNIALDNYLNTYIKYSIDSNNNRNGSGASSSLSLTNVSWNPGDCRPGGGPGMDVGSNAIWLWMKTIDVGGCKAEVFPISGIVRASNLVTVATRGVNDVAAGDIISLQNVADGSFNSSFTVASAPNNTHFTFRQVGPDTTSGKGQVITAYASAINIDSGPTGTGSGLIFIDGLNIGSAGVRLARGSSAYIRNVTYEGDFSSPAGPPVLLTGPIGTQTIVRVENLEAADAVVPVPGVRIDNADPKVLDAVIVRSAGQVIGPALVEGAPVQETIRITPVRAGQYGFKHGQITGWGIDEARRGFSPVAAPAANIANTNPSRWVFQNGTGTITTGIPAPDGTNDAGRVTGKDRFDFVDFYTSGTALHVGDSYVYGIWARSVNGNGFVNAAEPIDFGFGRGGSGAGDACEGYPGASPGGGLLIQGGIGSGQPMSALTDGQWQWFSGVCKVASNPTLPGTALGSAVSSGNVMDFYAPVLMLFPAGTKSDNEIWEIASNLSSISSAAGAGEVSMLGNQLFRPGMTRFSELGTPSSGVFIMCSDCTIANPCAGGGTGALAKRLGGSWVCN